ncbi:MAG: alpha/beta hydrolase [Anaerolineae bacterium]|nr:alpha/beta hydrolase [Anaerolineae bacterium]
MSAILLDSQVLHYEVLGRGRPLIFLHGWVGSWRYWIPTMQAASMNFRAYALDLWGFGDSAKVQTNYSLKKQVELLDHFLGQMGIGRVALVGHGLGAVIAVHYALEHPETVDRLMAVSYPLDETRIHPRLRAGNPADLVDWLLAKSPLTDPVRVEAPKADPQALAISVAEVMASAPREICQNLTRPCLFVGGSTDPALGALDLDATLRCSDQTHAILLEGSGHFPMLDDSSAFNRLLIDFLALGPGESPRQLQLKEEWKRRVR